MHLARERDVDLVFETAAVDFGHVRPGWPDAERGASLCFLTVPSRDECNFAEAEFVVCPKFEDRGLFAPFSDAQCLRRATRDRQLLVWLRAQLDFRFWPRSFDVVCDGDAGFKLNAGRRVDRYARLDRERVTY